MKESQRIWLICLLCFCTLSICLAQESGVIQGVVTDADGKPLPGADVHALAKGEFHGHRITHSSETSSDGKFLIGHLSWGTYILVAHREGSGYPDTRLAFYSNLQAPSATISANHPSADVTINLAPQAGWLTLSVVDANTGSKVTTAIVTLRRVANPNLFVTLSATINRIAIPADVDVQVTITAPGYTPWLSDGGPFVINLQSKEERPLDVQLIPKS